MEKLKRRSSLGYILAFLSGSFLTIAHFITKLQTQDFHPLQITAINASLCGISILIYLAIIRKSLFVCREEALYVSIHAVGHTGANILFFYSLAFIPAYDSTVIGSMSPIFGGILAWIFLGEKLDFVDIILICIVSVGLVMVCQPSFIFGSVDGIVISSYDRTLGTITAVLSSLCWAVTCCSNRKILKTGVLVMEFYVYLLVLFMSIIILAVMQKISFHLEFRYDHLWLLGISFSFLVGHALNCRALQLEEVCRLGVIKNVENVLMLILQWSVLGEVPTTIGFVGSVILLVCVIMFVLKDQIYESLFYQSPKKDVEFHKLLT